MVDLPDHHQSLPLEELHHLLGSSVDGLEGQEAARRLALVGPNLLQVKQGKPLYIKFLLPSILFIFRDYANKFNVGY